LGGVTLLVASAGGHLQELLHLLPSVGAGARVWVTYDTPQARSMLENEELVPAHHPTTKHLPNAVRNYRLARQVLAAREVGRLVSTGAAVAVPFVQVASRRGIPCHYIESATRVLGPSLSGRMLERVPRVHLYRQLGEWGGHRWQDGPSVFDGYEVSGVTDVAPPNSVVLSLGTHQFPFPALVDRVQEYFATDTAVTWQLGATPARPGLRGRTEDRLPAEELARLAAEVDVVVGHAGVGLALTALSAGKVPVLVPRRRARREHTDDHQVQLARELDRLGLAVVAEVGELTFEHLERAAALRVVRRDPPPFELVD
jgi:UDP-N-acetylglucosamine--N-acetylmuramyl-(pentapeptide) pyrophosphoryl-undecaprenol N-acetylglucosamine transferase